MDINTRFRTARAAIDGTDDRMARSEDAWRRSLLRDGGALESFGRIAPPTFGAREFMGRAGAADRQQAIGQYNAQAEAARRAQQALRDRQLDHQNALQSATAGFGKAWRGAVQRGVQRGAVGDLDARTDALMRLRTGGLQLDSEGATVMQPAGPVTPAGNFRTIPRLGSGMRKEIGGAGQQQGEDGRRRVGRTGGFSNVRRLTQNVRSAID